MLGNVLLWNCFADAQRCLVKLKEWEKSLVGVKREPGDKEREASAVAACTLHLLFETLHKEALPELDFIE
jgi:hypothetical protein